MYLRHSPTAIALVFLAFCALDAHAQNWGSGIRSAQPVEEDDAPKPGIEYFPKSKHLPNYGQNPERGPKISYADAVNCAALVDIINIARMRNPGDANLEGVGVNSTSSRHRAWDAMIATNPKLKDMSFQEAEQNRSTLLHHHAGKVLDPYLDNLPKLAKDYKRCQALRIVGLD